jgi:hypothetical protein
MSKYSLYGTDLIRNDNTLRDFAKCVYEGCPLEAVMEDGEERKDFIMEMVTESLEDDLSRTRIDYEELLYKYRSEIGNVLYDMDNHGIPIPEIKFFGDGAEKFFNELVYRYIDFNYNDFVSSKQTAGVIN